MIVYRLSKGAFKNDLSGKGAELFGGRWNSRGTALLYTASSRALCMAELAVNLPYGIVPKDYHMIAIQFPDKASLQEIDPATLPTGWNDFPHADATQRIGDAFVRAGKFLVLRVPSAVVEGDFNYLLNPGHPDFGKVSVCSTVPFSFDKRLFKR
ncbi:MAG: RES domain-containing protein [Chitinophagaceae bacterium]|nr:MAG: RES domain-containing protein [Chitinophagaceae bacterium]